MDGHPRQNPAYRPATGKPCISRAFPFERLLSERDAYVIPEVLGHATRMASNRLANGSVAKAFAIWAKSGNYRSVLFGFVRASMKGGEISLSRSASRLKSAIGRRSRVLSRAFRRHSFMSRT